MWSKGPFSRSRRPVTNPTSADKASDRPSAAADPVQTDKFTKDLLALPRLVSRTSHSKDRTSHSFAVNRARHCTMDQTKKWPRCHLRAIATSAMPFHHSHHPPSSLGRETVGAVSAFLLLTSPINCPAMSATAPGPLQMLPQPSRR